MRERGREHAIDEQRAAGSGGDAIETREMLLYVDQERRRRLREVPSAASRAHSSRLFPPHGEGELRARGEGKHEQLGGPERARGNIRG